MSFQCDILNCGYATDIYSHYTYHRKTHDNLRPFSCEICKQRFIQNCNLTIHKKTIHTLDKEVQVCQYCTPTSFSRKCYLNRHIIRKFMMELKLMYVSIKSVRQCFHH